MILYIKRIIAAIIVVISPAFSQEFEYSSIYQIPNLSFFPTVLSGLDVLEELNFAPLIGKRIAILTNHTAVNRKGVHLLDLLARKSDSLEIEIIYTPEFGLFGNESDAVNLLKGNRDPRFNAKIQSLWGRMFRPDTDDLLRVDLILIDLQDTGVRYTSYITTVTKVMEAAAISEIPVMILDRPNPLKGTIIDGPTVRPEYQSFIGYHLVPIRHGLTIGEYAIIVNETGWIRQSERVELTVIPVVNWQRDMWFDATKLIWVSPTPNIPNFNSLLGYIGMGLFEGTNVSDGRGTEYPYQLVGAPWMSGEAIIKSLNNVYLPGIKFSKMTFTPDSLSNLISNPPYRGQECSGVRFSITDREQFKPLLTAVTLLSIISRQYPNEFRWTERQYIEKLYGSNYLRIFIAQERDPKKLPATWTHDVIQFSKFREKFLLY